MASASDNPTENAVAARTRRSAKRSARGDWPTDPVVSERLRWVAHYAELGWDENRIAGALARHLPSSRMVGPEVVRKDLQRLLDYHRKLATADAATLLARISARFDSIYVTALDELRQSRVPRRVKLADGTFHTIEAASQSERNGLLAVMLRTAAAQGMLHFGPKGNSLTVNVDNRQQSVNVTPEAAASISLRDQLAEMRRLLAEDEAKDNRTRPKRLPSGQHPSKDIIDVEAQESLIAEQGLADEIEAIVRSQGQTGSFEADAQWEAS